MDKRILKTKRLLKQALLDLMQKKAFQKITVTEICEYACTSRITFYTYYEDKYALLEDVASDLKEEMHTRFTELQSTNNKEDDFIQRHLNIVDAILDIEERYSSLFTQNSIVNNLDAQFYYYQYILHDIEILEQRYARLNPKYPSKQLTAFLVSGLHGYFDEAEREGCNRSKTRKEVHSLMIDILQSKLFLA